jgi:hypothetical protein
MRLLLACFISACCCTLSSAAEPLVRVQTQSLEKMHEEIRKEFKPFLGFMENIRDVENDPEDRNPIAKFFFSPKFPAEMFPGIDTTKPFTAFAEFDFNNAANYMQAISGGINIPITDTKQFLEQLKKYEVDAELKENVYTLKHPGIPFPLSMKIEKNIAQVLVNVDPAKLTTTWRDPTSMTTPFKGFVTLDINLDQVPNTFRKLAIEAYPSLMEELNKNSPKPLGDLEAILLDELQKLGNRLYKPLVQETKRVSLDYPTLSTSVLRIQALPGTDLQKSIAGYQPKPHRFGSFDSSEMVAVFGWKAPLFFPEFKSAVTRYLTKVQEQLKGDDALPESIDLFKELIAKVIAGTNAGELDSIMLLHKPDEKGLMTFSLAQQLANSKDIEAKLGKLIVAAPNEMGVFLKWKTRKLNDIDVHTADLTALGMDQSLNKILGEKPILSFIFKDDAIFAAVGPEADKELTKLQLLKAAPANLLMTRFFPKRFAGTNMNLPVGANFLIPMLKEMEQFDYLSLAVEGGQELKIQFSSGLSSFSVVTSVRIR